MEESGGVPGKGGIFGSILNKKAKVKSLVQFFSQSVTGAVWGIKSFVTSRSEKTGEVHSRVGVDTQIEKSNSEKKMVVQVAPEDKVMAAAPEEGGKVVGQLVTEEVQVAPQEGERVMVQVAPQEGERVMVQVAHNEGERMVVPVTLEEGGKVVVLVAFKEGEKVMVQVDTKEKVMVQVDPKEEGERVVVPVVTLEEGEKVVTPMVILVEEGEKMVTPMVTTEDGEKVVTPVVTLEEGEKVVVPMALEERDATKEGENVVVPVAAKEGDKKMLVLVAFEEGGKVMVQLGLEEGEKVVGPEATGKEGEKVVVPVAALKEGERVVVPVAALLKEGAGGVVLVLMALEKQEKVMIKEGEGVKMVVLHVAPEEEAAAAAAAKESMLVRIRKKVNAASSWVKAKVKSALKLFSDKLRKVLPRINTQLDNLSENKLVEEAVQGAEPAEDDTLLHRMKMLVQKVRKLVEQLLAPGCCSREIKHLGLKLKRVLDFFDEFIEVLEHRKQPARLMKFLLFYGYKLYSSIAARLVVELG